MSRLLINIVLWAALYIVANMSNTVMAADQEMFDIYPIQVEGDIYGNIITDMTGDSLNDIVIFYSPSGEPSTRFAGLCINKGARGFANRPDYLVRLPQTAVQVDRYDIDMDGSFEIVFLDADGVSYIKYDQVTGLAKPRRLIRQNTIFSIPAFHGIIIEPFFVEFAEIEEQVAIIPTAKGYTIYEQEEGGSFEILNQLDIPIFCYNNKKGLKEFRGRKNASFSTELAVVRANDCNKDGYTDLYFHWSHKISCFIQDSTGNFPAEPSVELSFFPNNFNGFMQSWLDDLNGDGRLDAAVSYTTGGITNTETLLSFYLCGPDGKLSSNHSREIKLSDSHCNVIINDYNHDRIPELIVPALELGTIAATKMFLMKKADLHLLIYELVGGLPEEEPKARKKLEFRLNFDQPQPTKEVSVDWSSDFNGDNLNDLIFVDGGGNVKFYLGDYKDYISDKPDLEINLDHPLMVKAVSLGNNSLFDAVVEHNLAGKFDRITVFKNRGNWR